MRVLANQYKHIYKRLLQDVEQSGAKILIIPAMTVDAVASTKILASIFQQNEKISYSQCPVRGLNDFVIMTETYIQQALSECKPLSIICIDHAGGIDLAKLFHIYSAERIGRVFFTIFDSHRPFNLRNLNANNDQVRLILDPFDLVDLWTEQMPIDIDSDDEDFFYHSRSQYVNEEAIIDGDDDNDDDLVSRARREYNRLVNSTISGDGDHDDEDYEEFEEERGYGYEDDEEPGEEGEEGEDDENELKIKKKKTKLTNYDDLDGESHLGDNEYGNDHDDDHSQNSPHHDDNNNVDLTLDDDNDYNDPSHPKKRPPPSSLSSSHSTTTTTATTTTTTHSTRQKRTKLKKKTQKDSIAPQQPLQTRYRSQYTWDQAVEQYGRTPIKRAEYQKQKKQWYSQNSFASPTSFTLYNLARLNSVQNQSLLWCALVGLQEYLSYEKCNATFYSKLYTVLANDLESNTKISINTPSPGQNSEHSNPSTDPVLQFNRQRNTHLAATGTELVTDTSFKFNIDQEQAPLSLTLEQKLPLGASVETKYEYIFPFYRHWTIYDSMINTPAVVLAFKLYQDQNGLRAIKQVLAKIPLALMDAKKSYNLLSTQKLQIFFRMVPGYLEPFQLFQIFTKTFILKVSSSLTLSLFDFSSSILQFLDTISCSCSDEKHHNIPQATHLLSHLLLSATSTSTILRDPTKLSHTSLDISPSQSIALNGLTHNNSNSNNSNTTTNNNNNKNSLNGNSIDDGSNNLAEQHKQKNINSIGNSTRSFWPSYDLFSTNPKDSRHFKQSLDSAIKQYSFITTLAQTLFKSKSHLRTHDAIHYCLIPEQNLLAVQDTVLVTSYYGMTQLAFRLQELVWIETKQKLSAPFILGVTLPGTGYTLMLGVNPIIKSSQHRDGGILTQFSRNTYSQFNSLFFDAATRMGVDFIRDSFEYNLIYVKNDDNLKFLQQIILLSSRKEVRDRFYPGMGK
jgi:hypothetical protein